jgi:hypothetical protein
MPGRQGSSAANKFHKSSYILAGLPVILSELATLFYIRIYLERINKDTVEGETSFPRCIGKYITSHP